MFLHSQPGTEMRSIQKKILQNMSESNFQWKAHTGPSANRIFRRSFLIVLILDSVISRLHSTAEKYQPNEVRLKRTLYTRFNVEFVWHNRMFGIRLHTLRFSVDSIRAQTPIKMEFANWCANAIALRLNSHSLIIRKYLLVLVPIYFILQKQINANSHSSLQSYPVLSHRINDFSQ